LGKYSDEEEKYFKKPEVYPKRGIKKEIRVKKIRG